MLNIVLPFTYVRREFLGLIALGLLVMGMAIAVVSVKHLNRTRHTELQSLLNAQDQLHVEWTQLLLEQSALVSDMRVEQIARDELGMIFPDPKETVMIKP